MSNLIKKTPAEFVEYCQANDIQRLYFVWDSVEKRVRASHPALQEIADFLSQDKRDYGQHEGVFLQISQETQTLQGAFVHQTCRGQGQGGTRFWTYDTLEDFLRDGLRLSRGMTHKNALAGLWWGGGKGVIVRNPQIDATDKKVRQSIFEDYGRLVTSIHGIYITAEDVGTNTPDMASIFSKTRFITCIPSEVGGSGNPSMATARGVVRGMQGAAAFLDGSSLKGKTIAVQGMGNVAGPLIEYLHEEGAGKVIACDISADVIEKVKAKLPAHFLEARLVEKGDSSILSEECDILAPCATGAILNPQTIPKIRAKIVCGAANNQLEDTDRDDRALQEREILYVPDFLVNRLGIVNCANEQYGYIDHDPYVESHLDFESEHSVYQMTLKVLKRARETGETTAHAAVRLAEELAQEKHPIFGHRGQLIIDSLVRNHWENTRPS